LAPHIFPAAELAAARERLDAPGHEGHAMATADAGPFRQRLRSKAGWGDAAAYTVSDLTMLRRELVIGYVVAGFIAVAVPASVFNAVFVPGHGLLSDIANVIVGPFI